MAPTAELISDGQKQALVQFLEENPGCATNVELTPAFTMAVKQGLWQTIMRSLNAIGPITKTQIEWQAYWTG